MSFNDDEQIVVATQDLPESWRKKCFMLSAKELAIAWGDTPKYWRWISVPGSRFSEAVELLSVCWLEISGKMDTARLSPKTTYVAYFIYKLASDSYGLGNPYQEGSISLGAQTSQDIICLQPEELPHPMPAPETETTNRVPRARNDGWMEIIMGEFFNNDGGDGEVVIKLLETKGGHWKHGLIVQGIELRPNHVGKTSFNDGEQIAAIQDAHAEEEPAKMFPIVGLLGAKPINKTEAPLPEREEVIIEESRLHTARMMKAARELADVDKLDDAKDKIVEAQNLLEDAVEEPHPLIEMLKSELKYLLKLLKTKDIYEKEGRPFALSSETSHDRQRFAARGDVEKLRLFATPRMDAYLEQAKAFDKDPSKPLPTEEEDVKAEIVADPLASIVGPLSYYIQTAIQALKSIDDILNGARR